MMNTYIMYIMFDPSMLIDQKKKKGTKKKKRACILIRQGSNTLGLTQRPKTQSKRQKRNKKYLSVKVHHMKKTRDPCICYVHFRICLFFLLLHMKQGKTQGSKNWRKYN